MYVDSNWSAYALQYKYTISNKKKMMALDLLGDERFLEDLLVKLIKEQKRRDKGVVLLGQCSDQHHRC
jgi:hypothetical protein